MRLRILAVIVAVVSSLGIVVVPALGQQSEVIIESANIYCAQNDALGRLVPEVVYGILNPTSEPVSYEARYRVDDNPSTSMVGSGQLPANAGPVFSFQADVQPGRTITLEVELMSGPQAGTVLRSDPLTVPDCSGSYTIEGTARCENGAPVIDYRVTGPVRWGLIVSSPSDNPRIQPFAGEATGTLHPTGPSVVAGAEVTIGAHPLDILLQGGSTGFRVASDTVVIPDCSTAPTTTSTTTTLPPTSTSTTTSTTVPPVPPCDCEGNECRKVTTTKPSSYVERAEKESLTCFSARKAAQTYVVSGCGNAAALDRVFGKVKA
jgi:hypothetical protein